MRVEFSEVEAFGDTLKEFRTQKQLRSLDMARLLHMDAGKYRDWENRGRIPTYAEWKRVREALSYTE